LDEYLINFDFVSHTFVAIVKDIRIVSDAHCLSEAFSSIPSIKSAEKDLLTVVPSPRIVLNKSASCSSSEDDKCEISSEKSGSSVRMLDVELRSVSVIVEKIPLSEAIGFVKSGLDAVEEINETSPPASEQPNILPSEQSSCADKWIPTQNPTAETLSFSDNIDTVSADDEMSNTSASSGLVLPTPRKTNSDHAIDDCDPSVDWDIFHLSDSNSNKNEHSVGSHNVDQDASVHTPHTSRSNSPLSIPPSSRLLDPQPPPEGQADFLTWLSMQEPTVEICYLEESARAIEELRKIEPAQPFSDYFINFAFIE
uniref:Lipin_mid domain-containing protein n=1 Tax=Rodentolepis nana TaxID=102285 RepID=A0A0R3TRP1_RODNA